MTLLSPTDGLSQPARGPRRDLTYKAMNRKKNRGPKRVIDSLARNVRARMRARYKSARSDNGMIELLKQESGVGRSTIQRVLDPAKYGYHGTTLETIVKLAMALRCEADSLIKVDDDDETPD